MPTNLDNASQSLPTGKEIAANDGPEAPNTKQLSLQQFPVEERARVRVLLADIDDTITAHGMLPAASIEAMERLAAAGLIFIPVTGRPAGWCEHIARMWPVDAVVGENGAFYFSYDREEKKMRMAFAKTEQERTADRKKLNLLKDRIIAEIPGADVASDQDFRISDLAIDFCEDVKPLSKDKVQRIVEILEDGGATAKVSSIHVNSWFGSYDKLTMSRRCLSELFTIDIDKKNEEIVFVGDSPNDVPMFAYFKNSVGVANVKHFSLASDPTWVTCKESAAGFVELVDAILESKSRKTDADQKRVGGGRTIPS
jgi:HAD superfamily hydrolase (TIGR01484 family)